MPPRLTPTGYPEWHDPSDAFTDPIAPHEEFRQQQEQLGLGTASVYRNSASQHAAMQETSPQMFPPGGARWQSPADTPVPASSLSSLKHPSDSGRYSSRSLSERRDWRAVMLNEPTSRPLQHADVADSSSRHTGETLSRDQFFEPATPLQGSHGPASAHETHPALHSMPRAEPPSLLRSRNPKAEFLDLAQRATIDMSAPQAHRRALGELASRFENPLEILHNSSWDNSLKLNNAQRKALNRVRNFLKAQKISPEDQHLLNLAEKRLSDLTDPNLQRSPFSLSTKQHYMENLKKLASQEGGFERSVAQGNLEPNATTALHFLEREVLHRPLSSDSDLLVRHKRKMQPQPPASSGSLGLHPSGEASAPKREPSMPPPIVVPPDVVARGSAANLYTYTERQIDLGRTEFFPGQQEVFNVDTDAWEPMIADNAAKRLLVHHPMEPNPKLNFAFPLRASDEPLERVHPHFSDEWGNLHPAVQLNSVVSHFSTTGVRGLITSYARPIDITHDDLTTAIEGVRREVETELKHLMANSRANVDPRDFLPSLLDQRTYTRRVRQGDIANHEGELLEKKEYGLFPKQDQVAPTLRNGRILGIYMGYVFRGEAQEKRAIEAHPDDHGRYLLAADHGRSGVTNYSGAGAVNNTGFANTATRSDLKDYDRDRINAVFLPFEIGLTDKDGKSRPKSVSVLVGLDNLEPDRQILVNYGPRFLEQLQPPSERSLRAAERAMRNDPPRPAVKSEPSEQPLAPTGSAGNDRQYYADHVVSMALGQDLQQGHIGPDFYNRSIEHLREAIRNNPDIDNPAWIVEQTLLERRQEVRQDYQGYFDKMIRAAQNRAG